MDELLLNVLNTTSDGGTLSFGTALLTVFAAVISGMIISLTYMKTFGKGAHPQNFILTLIMIPPIVTIIILLVGSNVARAFSLAGVFSIIRFRSDPGDPKDITYIFFTLAAGLACGVGLIGYALIFTLLLCLLAIIVYLTKFGTTKHVHKQLRILIPEDLNYTDAFEDLFARYAISSALTSVRLKEMGSVFELNYDVVLCKDCNEKQFLDEIRCRNGNLSIMIALKTE